MSIFDLIKKDDYAVYRANARDLEALAAARWSDPTASAPVDPVLNAWLDRFIALHFATEEHRMDVKRLWPRSRRVGDVLDKLCTIYQREPQRWLADGEDDGAPDLTTPEGDTPPPNPDLAAVLSRWDNDSVNLTMEAMERTGVLHGKSVAWLQWSWRDQRPTMTTHNAAELYVEKDPSYPTDLDRASAVAIEIGQARSETRNVAGGLNDSKRVYAVYERMDDDNVSLSYRNRDGGFVGDQPEPAILPAMPVVPIAFVRDGSDFHTRAEGDWWDLPLFDLLNAWIRLAVKLDAFPPTVIATAADRDGASELKVRTGPGAIMEIFADERLERLASQRDFPGLLAAVEGMFLAWGRQRGIPPHEFEGSTVITSGVHRRLAREPLERQKQRRQKVTADGEARMFRRYVTMWAGCMESLGMAGDEYGTTVKALRDAAEATLHVKYPGEVTIQSEQEEAQGKAATLAVYQSLIDGGHAADLDEAARVYREQL